MVPVHRTIPVHRIVPVHHGMYTCLIISRFLSLGGTTKDLGKEIDQRRTESLTSIETE